jgi:hypothetical protein
MAAPSTPSVNSRCVYFPAQGTARSKLPINSLTPNFQDFAPGVPSGDILGPATGLPAVVITVGPGGSPDFAGTVLLVHDLQGNAYTRSAGQFGMVSTTTWSGAGSPAGVAHWNLVDVVT